MNLCRKKCWILILFVVVMVLQQSCHAFRRKRAVPNFPTSTENKGNNSETSTDKHLKEFWNRHNGGLCPIGQVFHKNKTVCCEIAVCGPDYEIIECASNGTADKCSRCKNNYIQKHNISSLDMADAKCFPKVDNHDYCAIDDMRPARKIMHKDNFPLPCECKLEMCYVEDDIGSCTLKNMCSPGRQLSKTGYTMTKARSILHPKYFPYPCECLFEKCNILDDVGDCSMSLEALCGPNYQMNRKSGTCEPCPWYTYKNVSGCEPCTINKTLLQQHIYVTPAVRTTTVQAEERHITPTEDQSLSTRLDDEGIHNNESDRLIPVYAVLGVIFVIVMVIVGILCCKRRTSSGPQVPPPTPDNVPLMTEGHVVLTPTRDGYGNALYLPNNQRDLYENGNNRNNVGNGDARHLHEGNIDNIGANHIHENGNAGRGQGVEVANGSLPNGNVPNSVQKNNVDVEQRSNESQGEQLETEMKTKESDKMNERKTGKVDLSPASNNFDTNKERHDLEEVSTNGSPEGACGSETLKLDDTDNKEGYKGNELKDMLRGKNKISIHGNEFKNCKILIGAKFQGIRNAEPLTSISGSFDNNSSLKSEDSFVTNSAETFKQPGRRNGNQVTERVNEEDCENEGQKAPFCRPELSNLGFGTQGKDIQSRQKDCVEGFDEGEMDLEQEDPKRKQHTKKLLTERSMSVPPLQDSVSRGRPVGRVAPTVRQNSGDEVRHVSGYPSSRQDEDSASSEVSMSYAVLHADSQFSNGFISRDIADTNDFSEVDVSQHSQLALQGDVELNRRCVSIPNSGSTDIQRQTVRNGAGLNTVSDLQSNLDVPPLTRLNGSRINATNPVPPMSQREEPEGDSVTYEPHVSRPYLEQTDRKALMNGIDQDETDLKEVACVSTTAKTLDEDDDITEYKRKIKEEKESRNDTDLKNEDYNDARGRSGLLSTEESFELTSEDIENKFNVENILYQEDKTSEDSSVSKTMESSDKSFEISSKDIDVVESSEKASESVTFEKNDSSDSYEIDANDLKNIEKVNDEIDNESFIESENRNMLETEQAVDTREIVSNCSGETSFEINSSEVNNLHHNEETDIAKVSNENSENDENLVVANTADDVSEDAAVSSSSDLLEYGKIQNVSKESAA